MSPCSKSKARQTPFTGKRLHDSQEALRFLELGFPFDLEQLIAAPGTGIIPAFWHDSVVFCHILVKQHLKASFLNQSFILTRWGKEKVANGTPDGYLLVREHAGDDDGIGEEQASTGTQHAMPFLQDLQATGQMIDGVNADDCRKRVILKGKCLTGIAVLKVNACVKSKRLCPRVGSSRTARV